MNDYIVIKKSDLEEWMRKVNNADLPQHYSPHTGPAVQNTLSRILHMGKPLQPLIKDAWENGARAGWTSASCEFDGTEEELDDIYSRDPLTDYIKKFKL